MFCCKGNFFVVIASLLSSIIVTSCGDISSKTVSSGSSDFGFINYYINPVSANIITSIELGTGTTGLTKSAALSGQEIDDGIKSVDTSANIFDVNYCEYFADNYDYQIETSSLIDGTFAIDPLRSAPFIAEKSYLELMKNYCYSNLAFYLIDTRINIQTDNTYGEIRWFRNKNASLDATSRFDFLRRNSIFDYMISQGTRDNSTRVLTVFNQVSSVNQRVLYGNLKLTKNNKNGNLQLKLIRYLVDDDTKDEILPKSFRQEAYAIATDVSGDFKVHSIATYLLDYTSGSELANANKLTIHHNTSVVYENWGSKLATAVYCEYPVGTVIYDCEGSSATRKLTLTSPIYFGAEGEIITPGSVRNNNRIAVIESVVNMEVLDNLKESFASSSDIQAPIELTQEFDPAIRFDTSKPLNFN